MSAGISPTLMVTGSALTFSPDRKQPVNVTARKALAIRVRHRFDKLGELRLEVGDCRIVLRLLFGVLFGRLFEAGDILGEFAGGLAFLLELELERGDFVPMLAVDRAFGIDGADGAKDQRAGEQIDRP